MTQAFREAAEQTAAEAAAPRPAAPPADATEVARVLAAISDYDCLKVCSPSMTKTNNSCCVCGLT